MSVACAKGVKRWLVALGSCALAAASAAACGPSDPNAQQVGGGPTAGQSNGVAGAGVAGIGGASASSGGIAGAGAGSGGSGVAGSAGVAGAVDHYVVALLQSPKSQAADLTAADVAELVGNAVSQAGGLDFIHDGQTVVLKPNLVTMYEDAGEHTAATTVNGVSTDFRVVKALADLVRAKNPSGKILVMEGSRILTSVVFSVLGYSADNFGSELLFAPIEGDSCSDPSTSQLEQRTAASGKQYWVDKRYIAADVVIAVPTLATDAAAGIGGAVESLGIGATPAGQYGSATNSIDCTRSKIDQSSPEAVGEFIRDYYSLRPPDFVVMDGLQGLQHGPLPAADDSGTYDYASSIMNMRLILAGRNAVAVDTIAAMAMKCLPNQVPHLLGLQTLGLGSTDPAKISVVGKTLAEVAKPFASKQKSICPDQ